MPPTPFRPQLRLLAIVAAGLLPALGLVILLLAPMNRDVAAARREQRGLEYLAAIKAFAKAALDHRRTAGEYVAGTSDNVQVARRAETVDSALRDLESLDARLGNDSTRAVLADLRGEWQTVSTNLPAWARADDFPTLLQRSAAVLRHTGRLAEAVNAATEPAPGANSLQDALLVLLDDVDALSQAALVTRQAARAPRLERGAEGRLHRLLERLTRNQDAYARSITPVAERYRPVLAMNSDDPRAKLTQALGGVLRDAAPVDEPTATAMMALGERAIAEDFERFDTASRALSDVIAERTVARERTIVWAAITVVVGLTLALLAAYFVGRTLARPAPAAPAAPAPGLDKRHVDQLRRLADRIGQASNALGEIPVRIGRAGGQVARLSAGVRGIEPAARLLEEMADEASVAAVNLELRAAAGGVGVAPDVDRLAERSAATVQRVIELARAAEAETVAMGKGLREISLADIAHLSTLAAELDSVVDKLDK
jgi:hypothetical protein